ncbi:MAG: dephospho-CoA kinase [Bacteroidia bacterium]
MMVRQIGITGGIGSGKTTVARKFIDRGFLVYFADDRAKAIYDENEAVKTQVKAIAGADVYDEAGRLRRPALAERIFKDKALLKQINAVLHPAVARDYAAWIEAIPASYDRPFVMKEAAILMEVGNHLPLQGTITVYAPKSIRIKRVISRDSSSSEQVLSRMANQWSDFPKMQQADFILFNDGIHPIDPQIEAAIKQFSPS